MTKGEEEKRKYNEVNKKKKENKNNNNNNSNNKNSNNNNKMEMEQNENGEKEETSFSFYPNYAEYFLVTDFLLRFFCSYQFLIGICVWGIHFVLLRSDWMLGLGVAGRGVWKKAN